MHTPFSPLTALAYRLQKEPTIIVSVKDHVASIATRHDVVKHACILNAQTAGH
jgi:hypothetical protein